MCLDTLERKFQEKHKWQPTPNSFLSFLLPKWSTKKCPWRTSNWISETPPITANSQADSLWGAWEGRHVHDACLTSTVKEIDYDPWKGSRKSLVAVVLVVIDLSPHEVWSSFNKRIAQQIGFTSPIGYITVISPPKQGKKNGSRFLTPTCWL